MLTLTEEQERITNYEYKQTLLCLRDKISKYHGKMENTKVKNLKNI